MARSRNANSFELDLLTMAEAIILWIVKLDPYNHAAEPFLFSPSCFW